MGGEFGQWMEWVHKENLEWHALYRAFFGEFLASENASRFSSMQGAERNIEEMLSGLHARSTARGRCPLPRKSSTSLRATKLWPPPGIDDPPIRLKGTLMEQETIVTLTINPSIDTSLVAVMTYGTHLCRREDAERLHWEMCSQKSNHPKGEKK